MGFNFGAFAGGLAKGGMDTYQLMEAVESQKKRDELIQNQLDEAKALKTASAETYGQVGAPETALPGRKMSEADVANAYAIDQGDPTAVAPKTYTREQADADYLTKVRGISPERALAVEAQQLQIKSGRRADKFEEDFEAEKNAWNKKSADLMTRFDDALTKDGANGVIKEIGPEFKAITGKQISLVGNDIVVGTGKDAERIPAKDIRGAFESAMQHHYTNGFAESLVKKGMFKSANDAISHWQKSEELKIAREKNDIARDELGIKKPLYAAQANWYNQRGAGGGGGGGGAAGKAAQAEALVKSGAAKDVQAAYRIMASKDSRSAIDQDWAAAERKHEENQLSPAEIANRKVSFYARNGFAPAELEDSIRAGKSLSGKAYDPKDAAKIISDFNKKYPNSPVDISDLSWASPKAEGKTEAKTESKAASKEEPKTESKPKSAIPPGGFYSPEAVAARKADRKAREDAALDEERKKRERDMELDAKVKSALRAGLPTRGED